jgi:urease accessory protein
VAAGGWLEVFPEIFIPQGGARYRQKTTVELEEGAGFLFFETLAPGRVASGEVFAFGFLDWETDICWNGERVAREKYRVAPEDLRPLRQRFPTAYYACIFFFHPGLTPDHPCWESIGGVHDESTWVGHGRLHRQGWSIKVLSADSVRFRKALQQIRGICYEATGQCIPAFRKF